MRSVAGLAKPVREVGDFFALTLDVGVQVFRRPFAWSELISQIWFVSRVSLLPTVLLAIPFTTLVVFMLNILLGAIGASDFAGAGAALSTVDQIGPVVTVLVVAGAGCTAMCADLGARTIREELDAMRVMGIDPVQTLIVPRVIAGTIVAMGLAPLVIGVGITGSFFFSVYVQHVTPGAFAASLTVLVGVVNVVVAIFKAAVFGLIGSLIACYKGVSVGGGPLGVGTAVNETVVYTFMALFVVDLILTVLGTQVIPK